MSPISALLKLHSTGFENLWLKRSPLEVYRQRNVSPSRSDSAIVQSSSESVTESSPAGSGGTSPKLSRTPSFTSILKKWSEAFRQRRGSGSSESGWTVVGSKPFKKTGSFTSHDANSKHHQSENKPRRSWGFGGNNTAPNVKVSERRSARPSSMESYVSASSALKLPSNLLKSAKQPFLPSSLALVWETPRTRKKRVPSTRD